MDVVWTVVIGLVTIVLFLINLNGCFIIVQEDITFDGFWEDYKDLTIGQMLFMFLCIPSLSFLIFYNVMKWKPFGNKK
jgi:hypothetical protein